MVLKAFAEAVNICRTIAHISYLDEDSDDRLCTAGRSGNRNPRHICVHADKHLVDTAADTCTPDLCMLRQEGKCTHCVSSSLPEVAYKFLKCIGIGWGNGYLRGKVEDL